jgi:anion-transporting  ArsA/GET3 family ATPase
VSAASRPNPLRGLITSKKVVVCVGSGGVGKTTTAATLGIAAAALGRRTLVITIDPARRLANALGLDALAHTPQAVDASLVARAAALSTSSASSASQASSTSGPAPLAAMMLDVKAGWDEMLLRTAPSPQVAAKVQENRFYKVLSTELPGAHEFIACEMLHHLASSGAYDLVVLDTPPTQNALDFLDAPARILSVLDSDAFRFMAERKESGPSFGLRLFDSASDTAQSIIARFTGGALLEELSDFLVLLRDLYAPLTTRTKEFVALLGGDSAGFVVVTAPETAVLNEASFFAGELSRRGLPLAAVVVNRVTASPDAALAVLADDAFEDAVRAAVGDGADAVVAALDLAVRQEERLAWLEQTALAGFGEGVGVPQVHLPRLSEAVHDAARLLDLVPHILGPSGPRGPQAGP